VLAHLAGDFVCSARRLKLRRKVSSNDCANYRGWQMNKHNNSQHQLDTNKKREEQKLRKI
jgi:hypothetical protein